RASSPRFRYSAGYSMPSRSFVVMRCHFKPPFKDGVGRGSFQSYRNTIPILVFPLKEGEEQKRHAVASTLSHVHCADAQRTCEFIQPLSAPARGQSRALAGMEGGDARICKAERHADPAVDRIFGVPLVPRDGARELPRRSDRARDERAVRQRQAGSRGAAGPRPRLSARASGAERARRWLAADGLSRSAGSDAILRRHVLSAFAAAWIAGIRRTSATRARVFRHAP